MRVLQESVVAGSEEENMNAERLAEIRENQKKYMAAYEGCVIPGWLKDYAADVGDLLAVMDALSGPVIWHYKAGCDASKEAVMKAAKEQMDRVNIAVPYLTNAANVDIDVNAIAVPEGDVFTETGNPVALHNAKPFTMFAAQHRGEQWAVRALEEIRIGDMLENATDDKGYGGVRLVDREEAERRMPLRVAAEWPRTGLSTRKLEPTRKT